MVCLCNYTMNKDEFSILTKRLRSEIVAIGARYLKDEEEAEDNAQDTLLKLWTIRGQLLQCSSVEGLAYTICKNLCISKLRKRKVVPIELNEEMEHISQNNAQWMLEEKENSGCHRRFASIANGDSEDESARWTRKHRYSGVAWH